MFLESQILYSLRRADECIDIYHKLQHSKIHTLETNMVACLVFAGKEPEVREYLSSVRVKPTSISGLAFNTSCSLIQNQNYNDAEHM
ncbi:hypothetical protein DM860_002169 [Cuscuta australis]|uniref:Coatomer alpha subunit C-terminal domain-containing protein n=1 Tax=Cuscuta australis TaxID=267555 RepID=A0A328DZF5_9ASTE|nr:hypothetical protein DM860_002169 [Cuscuta australis]